MANFLTAGAIVFYIAALPAYFLEPRASVAMLVTGVALDLLARLERTCK